ncbi:MAG TPA: 50S ribosomal protein L23 [Clostridia bacterium]|nr:50S ribosomal protein L23 [Clostridia bacterium]
MIAENIIIAPVVTEKSNDGLSEGKYTFKVNKKATKVDIAKAVEKLFEVKVLRVNTLTVKGKEKRVGKSIGRTSSWKKAIVTIDTNPTDKNYIAKGGKTKKVSKKYNDSIEAFN